MTAYLADLHKSLDERWRPEDVLRVIVNGDPDAGAGLNLARYRQALTPMWTSYYTSMSTDYHRPVGGSAVLASVARAFQQPVDVDNPDDPAELRATVEQLGAALAWNGPQHLTREQRAAAGVELSRRKYNRQLRALRRLDRKADKLGGETSKRELLLIGHSGFAHRITLARFTADPVAAQFIAYWTARKNQRRQFSLSGRDNPMDVIAQCMLDRCAANDDTDWEMIAYVRPTGDVLARLTEAQKGDLLGQWVKVLRHAAEKLQTVWDPEIDRTTMTVRRGMDSSTWNTVAQAYNAARSSWLSCLTALGAEQLLDAVCPGKVMRLMAADLQYWHSVSGHDIEPNTKVWAVLPLPWDVLDGRQPCPRAEVEMACRFAGLDPAASGWTAPKPAGEPAPFTLTPELVHGVTVADPAWAALLRRAGVFSGKRITTDPELARAATSGLVKGVVVSDLPARPFLGA